MVQNDEYKSIEAPVEGLFRDNGSRFIAKAYPVTDTDRVKEIVDALKKEYYDARHHCYAYRIGCDGSQWRANDDGEPSGSSARPILGQIDSMGLSDILVVVIRYFGGIKLGIPGLIRAYKTSTQDALDKAVIITKYALEPFEIEFGWEQMDKVLKVLRDSEAEVTERNYDNMCRFRFNIRSSRQASCLEKLKDIENTLIRQIL